MGDRGRRRSIFKHHVYVYLHAQRNKTFVNLNQERVGSVSDDVTHGVYDDVTDDVTHSLTHRSDA